MARYCPLSLDAVDDLRTVVEACDNPNPSEEALRRLQAASDAITGDTDLLDAQASVFAALDTLAAVQARLIVETFADLARRAA